MRVFPSFAFVPDVVANILTSRLQRFSTTQPLRAALRLDGCRTREERIDRPVASAEPAAAAPVKRAKVTPPRDLRRPHPLVQVVELDHRVVVGAGPPRQQENADVAARVEHEGARAGEAIGEREERRLSMEREFREILPHTSIGKRRAGWEAPVYWKDKDPRAPPPDASGGSDAAALCAAAAAARREAAAARLRPDEPRAAPPVDRAVSAAAYDIGDAITRPKVEPDQAPIEWVAPPKRPTSPDGFDFFPDIDERDDNNRAPAPPPGAWWWERLAHGVQNCGPLIEACGDPCHTVVDDDTYPAPAGWNPPPRVRRGTSPPRAPPRGGHGPA